MELQFYLLLVVVEVVDLVDLVVVMLLVHLEDLVAPLVVVVVLDSPTHLGDLDQMVQFALCGD
jgi:hypothetical protein